MDSFICHMRPASPYRTVFRDRESTELERQPLVCAFLSFALFGLSTELLFLFSAAVFHIHEMLTLYTMSPAAAGRLARGKTLS